MFNIFICTYTTTTDMKETTISFQNNVSSTLTSNILLENKTGIFLYILSVAFNTKIDIFLNNYLICITLLK